MQLHRLEVEGFGPFRARQIVDFDAFVDDGIFLIAGRTGAGKSSILDAVCFGLYGGVPRYEGGDKKLRSDYCDADDVTEVTVEFSTAAGRFRVTRSPEYERPKKRGDGTTIQPAAVRLDALMSGEWVGIAAREREAALELDDILQLSREQFLQVILLAQNRFSQFLLANSRERQALLRRLFGTERFDTLQSRFDARRRAAESAWGLGLAAVTARLEQAERLALDVGVAADQSDAVPGAENDRSADSNASTTRRLEELRRFRARADYRTERLGAERDAAEKRSREADAELAVIRDRRRAHAERDRARAALAEIEAAEPSIAQARTELANARAAEALRATVDAARRAEAEFRVAVAAETEALAAWSGHGIAVDDLSAWVADRLRESGSWQRAKELEGAAPALADDLLAAEHRVQSVVACSEQNEHARSELPAQRTALVVERDEARRMADRAGDLLAAHDEAVARHSAAQQASYLTDQLSTAERVLAEASTVLASEQAALAGLRQRRLDGYAGELASSLSADDACPVCGSHEHPAPATHVDPVSPSDITAAEAARDTAARRERDAADAVSEIRAELAAATSRADGRDIDTSARELAAASETHAESIRALDLQLSLERQLADIELIIEDSERRHGEDLAAIAQARQEHAILVEKSAESAAAIDQARGAFSSVAERLRAAEIEIAAAQALQEAVADREHRAQANDAAARELESSLAGSAFGDVRALESAFRPVAAQEALETRIAQHAAQREKERSVLLQLELQALPEEAIDVDAAESVAAAARASWMTAVDDASRAARAAEQLAELIESAASEHLRTADAAAEFDVVRSLADTIAGREPNTYRMTLETFVLAAELEEIVRAANRRLADMSTGRYQLRHSDAVAARGAASGLGIDVFDSFTGQTRPARSLSGGETFLSSLALALGLAEVVTARAGGVRLDTLFIDEGFGSLDSDTLEVAMRTLDELRQGGRTVGVISHVEAMQEQIPAQLSVRATAHGPSVIRPHAP